MVNCRFFVRDSDDLEEMNEWLKAHGDATYVDDMLPDTGIIVDGVAVGFLLVTDTAICFLEGFVSNPKASSEIRHRAITAITDSLLEEAKERGFKKVVVLTSDPSIMSRAIAHGFEDSGFKCLFSRRV